MDYPSRFWKKGNTPWKFTTGNRKVSKKVKCIQQPPPPLYFTPCLFKLYVSKTIDQDLVHWSMSVYPIGWNMFKRVRLCGWFKVSFIDWVRPTYTRVMMWWILSWWNLACSWRYFSPSVKNKNRRCLKKKSRCLIALFMQIRTCHFSVCSFASIMQSTLITLSIKV
jgi:hypothetical protein